MVCTIIVEKGEKSYGAYAPDVPGCVAVGDTMEEVVELMSGALRLHLESMIEDGEPLPQASSVAVSIYVEVDSERAA